ncbi:prepilin-type N-terminal cleavage/methylation domain-containing protein [Sulfurimonas sp. SAG-AH-194-C21]|nr:type II secretion system protein [Sulfurimonas sp. SAG-AH-194-C21]MDF1883217.1 prepilin-type N-terminal cleavage/methylation domain-containing protein [Sulfurimonas sp. SAG-AH-194-C21]
MRKHTGFTMLELVFVIVIMGIIGKFGVEFLAQAYKSFIFTTINTKLQTNSESTLEFISSRLQYRIKDSLIARINSTSFDAISNIDTTQTYDVLEWISTDIAGFRGNEQPFWSGIIDLDNVNATNSILISPATDTSEVNTFINTLSNTNSSIDDAALYFIGSNSDINGYGWDGVAFIDQSLVMHPINDIAGQVDRFAPAVGNFSGVDIYEYYKLSWTANAIVMEDYNTTTKMGNLVFHYDYQPWNGEKYNNSGQSYIIMENVSTFQFMAIGSLIKIQVCVKTNLIEEYSLCKEKTIF